MKLIPTLAVAGLLALSLGACNRDQATSDEAASDPAAAVDQLVRALHDNDAVRFNRVSLPDDLYAQTQARWIEQREALPAATQEEAVEFEQTMAKLTAPDAEAQLYAELEPLLDRYDAEIAAQLPMAVAMGNAFASQAIQANETMSSDQKRHATEVLGAIGGWVGSAPLGDRQRARQAIEVVTDSARRLDLRTAEDYRRLDYEPMLERVSVVMEGGKRIFAIYGLDIDPVLASVKTQTLSESGDSAQVRVSYDLLGQNIAFNMDMVRIDGGWYSADLIDSAREQLQQPLMGLEADEHLDEPEEYEDEEIIEEDALPLGGTAN